MNRKYFLKLNLMNSRLMDFSLFILLIISFTHSAWAKDWYVSQNGSGTRDGMSPENAFRRIYYIPWETIQPGDTVYIVGEITGYADFWTNGKVGDYITVTAYDANTVINANVELHNSDWLKLTNLTINGIVTQDGGPSEYLWLDHLTIDGDGTYIIVKLYDCDHVRVSYCTITNGKNGIWTGAWRNGPETYITIDHCTISNMSGDVDSHCIGMEGGENCLIEYNDLSYANTGITLFGNYINNTIVRYNHVHHMEGTRATGGIDYQRGYGIGFEGNIESWATRTGNHVYNNIIHDCTGVSGAYIPASGIRAKFYDNTNYIYNNTVYNCSPNYEFTAMKISSAWQPMGGIFKNNISYMPNSSSSSRYQVHVFYDGSPEGFSGLEFNNNLYYPDGNMSFGTNTSSYSFSNWKAFLSSLSVTGSDSGSLCEDPLFANTSGSYSLISDFIPQDLSPAIDNGNNDAWIGVANLVDYTGSIQITNSSGEIIAPGNVVDIGVFEVTLTDAVLEAFDSAVSNGVILNQSVVNSIINTANATATDSTLTRRIQGEYSRIKLRDANRLSSSTGDIHIAAPDRNSGLHVDPQKEIFE